MRYYTFEIDGQKVGFYEESNENGILSSNARMIMQGELFENSFSIKHVAGKVTAYQYGDTEWKDFKEKEGVYPTSALALIVSHVKDSGQFEYTQYIEGQGKIGKKAVLRAEDEGVVNEYIEGKPVRRVVVKEGVIIEYGWGGTAKSEICESKAEAVKGTRWE
jgi:hypothetical protein